ncbi:MAG TPA: DUF5689 domain-containing protein [Williamwhitmania sp.]|nr:DUF5689 domain-containing protein [Williamwhitmania sp.]
MLKKIIPAVLFIAAVTAITNSSCVKDTYSDPVAYSDTTSLTANTTIAELKSKYAGSLVELSSNFIAGRDSIIIEGYVTSDDKTGNFYKSIFIQDATGGIQLMLNKTSLYNFYQRGQRLVVVCKGMYMGDYGGQVQIGSLMIDPTNNAPAISGLETDYVINQHVFKKGKVPVEVTPSVIIPASASLNDVSKLVQINNTQFLTLVSPIDNSRLTYADPVGNLTLDYQLAGMIGSTYSPFVNGTKPFVVRTSGYAKFAGDTLPSLNGTIVGVLSYYNGTYQLVVRDTKDVQFVNPRL